ncbi:MAG: response regulator [Saprospiraceae bacterium]|nr:response regulator [Candidatus Opimibacter iunctus]
MNTNGSASSTARNIKSGPVSTDYPGHGPGFMCFQIPPAFHSIFRWGWLVLILILPGGTSLHAQSPTDALWSRIEARLDQPNVDTSYQFILEEIAMHCGHDARCLMATYDTIAIQLEKKFKLAAATKVTKASIGVAEQEGLILKMAQGNYDLCRYYDALKNPRYAVAYLDQALRYFEEADSPRKVIKCKFWKVKLTSSPDGLMTKAEGEALDTLIREAMVLKDSILAGSILVHRFSLGLHIDPPEKSKAYLDLLERMTDPASKNRSANINLGDYWNAKGSYELEYGDALLAKSYFENALAVFNEIEDPWRTLFVTIHVIETDWALGNHKEAKDRLAIALKMSEAVHSEDLYLNLFRIASRIAEEEGHFQEALDYQKRMFTAQERIYQNGDEKIANNYYLEVENKQNASTLKARNNQLLYTIIIIALVLMIATGLWIGWYKQRKARKTLTAQNLLIQEQAEQLKALDAAKSRFFANVSHELRTPLTLLTSPIRSLLKENQLTEKQTQLLHMADRSGQQLSQLINEILDLRKLEMGKMNLSPEPTELRTYFQTYFAQFESLAVQKEIDYQLSLSMPEHAMADLDREKCRQILFNLLSNAFKFTPQGGRIEVTVNATDDTLSLAVADNGPGIHPDDLHLLFDRYFQTTRPEKGAEGGTGIGLALCREYVQLFGGHINVQSTLGKGATFTVNFPIALNQTKQVSVSGEARSDIPELIPNDGYFDANTAADGVIKEESTLSHSGMRERPTILLVEDNPELRKYIRLVLEEKYRVVTAVNGQDALMVIANHESGFVPDLILSDLMMPVMDGYQLLERLKSDDKTRHIPVVMLTARAEAQDKLKALRIGVDDYLTKPFDEEELLVRIENLLNNQASRRTAITPDDSTPSTQEVPAAPLMSAPDREWLEAFEAYVQKHFAGGTLSVSSLAYEFAMSESTLLRQLKRLTGLTPLQNIQEVRLNEARRLLENRTYNSVAQVASKVGYEDASSFTRVFKQRFGKRPSELMEA